MESISSITGEGPIKFLDDLKPSDVKLLVHIDGHAYKIRLDQLLAIGKPDEEEK